MPAAAARTAGRGADAITTRSSPRWSDGGQSWCAPSPGSGCHMLCHCAASVLGAPTPDSIRGPRRLIQTRPGGRGALSSSASIVQLACTVSRPPPGRRFAIVSPAKTRHPLARIRRLRGRREERSQAGSATRAGRRVQEILDDIPQSLARAEHVIMADARKADQACMASHGLGQLVCHPGPCECIF